MERFTVQLQISGKRFDFELCGQELDLGAAGKVWFYWLDTKKLRAGKSANHHACVDHWWACMESQGLADYLPGQTQEDKEQVAANQELLVLAELYTYVSKSKGQQTLVRDATPRPKELHGPGIYSLDKRGALEELMDHCDLPEDEKKRLRAVAASKDVKSIGEEIRDALVGDLPPDQEKPRLNAAFGRWVKNGVAALRKGGRQGLSDFLHKQLVPWYTRYRRLGNVPGVKTFINMVAYEAKVSFYTCFSNAWVGLRAWLRQHRSLSATSEHLMRLLHNQNPRDNGGDVFWGLVLSLHPIAAILMQQPHHQYALGDYLCSLSGVPRSADPDLRSNAAYWDLVGSILIACKEYRQLLALGETHRLLKCADPDMLDADITRDEAPLSESQVFENYAGRKQLTCNGCSGKDFRHDSFEVVDYEWQVLQLIYRCRACDKETQIQIQGGDLLPDNLKRKQPPRC